MSSVFAE